MAPPLGSAVSGGMTARLAAERAAGDPHLRSSAEVIGYDIEASDGGVGHIDDFLFDERSLAIRYAVVDSRRGAALAALRSLRGALMAATPPFAERDAATA